MSTGLGLSQPGHYPAPLPGSSTKLYAYPCLAAALPPLAPLLCGGCAKIASTAGAVDFTTIVLATWQWALSHVLRLPCAHICPTAPLKGHDTIPL